MYRPVLVTAPKQLPLTLEEVKAHCRVDHNDEDDLIYALLTGATAYMDGWSGTLGLCLVSQIWRQDFDAFNYRLRLPLFPVIRVEADGAITGDPCGVRYLDVNNVEQTVGVTNYDLLVDDEGAFVRFNDTYSFPTTRVLQGPRVSVTFAAGFGADAPTVPQTIRQALLLLIGHWYANRETINVGTITSEIGFTVGALSAPYRRVRF